MAKAHRRYQHTWWEKRYSFASMSYYEWKAKMDSILLAPSGRYTLPFLRYEDDEDNKGIILQAPFTQPAQTPEQHTTQRRLEQNRARRDQEHFGVPSGDIDPLLWLANYLKIDKHFEELKRPITKDGKEDYYQDVIYQIYRSSGYSHGECTQAAYSYAAKTQREELMRYLSDDKRHPLNRNRDADMEQIA